MKVLISIIFISVFINAKVFAQYIPIQIYDLKVLTDSLNEDYLFFRIQEDLKNSDYYRRKIYQLNVEKEEEKLFLEHFFDNRFGFDYLTGIKDYALINNSPNNFINVTRYCDNECSEYVIRYDRADGIGSFFITITDLNLEANTDSGLIYVNISEETIIGRNGGKDWPDFNEDNNFEVSDSSKLNFPLTSLSPYNDSLMFGIEFQFGSDNNAFYRSVNAGLSKEFISDTLFGFNIEYDNNESIVYLIDTINFPGSNINCSIDVCSYGLYTMDVGNNIIDWNLKTIFTGTTTIKVHPIISGRIYAWNDDSVAVSEDFGETFNTLANPEEDVTGFTVSENFEYYSTTYNLYKIDNGNSIQLRSIPISNETEDELPAESELLQNYPNPFNPSTTINYKMKKAGVVQLQLYDITGRFVQEIVNEYKSTGEHKISFDASNLSSGTYFILGKLGETISTQMITLIK